jgi:crotonobetainyl-CoA:carnitine CoA-transferase CaiB-like acyl-CoA transferase
MTQRNEPAHAALNELLDLAGLPRGTADRVSITGNDPVIPTRYRMGTSGAALQAAHGLAASELWRLRTGRTQTVSVDTPAATVSLRSSRYMRIDGKAPPREHAPLMRFYRVKNGRYVFLHANFPNLKDAALRILGAKDDPADVERAMAGWEGEALETALHEGGACGSYVRTHAEWDAHPHAAAVRSIPVLEITKIGEAPPRPLPAGDRPMAGIRVLDLTRVIAGPTCARTMAEHGADVLKIARQGLADSGLLDLDTGIGKLSAWLDLREKDQYAKLWELIGTADVFSQSYRPGTLAGRGFSPQELAERRPGIIYTTLSAWGHEGPWRLRRGYDTVVQSATGWAEASGDASGPKLQPVSAIDYVAGNLMAFGTMVALYRRATVGGSWMVRTSLAQAGRWIVDRGVMTPAEYGAMPDDLPAETLNSLCAEMDSPVGKFRYLAPIVRMSETPARWVRPPAPLGHHPAAWP